MSDTSERVPPRLGPGGQPESIDGVEIDCLALPRQMDRFRRSDTPSPEALRHLPGLQAVLTWAEGALARWQPGSEPLVADLAALDDRSRAELNDILGEGEVSLTFHDGYQAQAQESVYPGIWRILILDAQGQVSRDLLEVGDVPFLARRTDAGQGEGPPLAGHEPPPGVMNAPALLTELDEALRRWQPGRPAHAINLSLLPLSEADRDFLAQVLGEGPVRILSRGYGQCRIDSTAWPHIWRVRYYNSSERLILDTLEVGDVPLVACAAPEDLADSRQRIDALLAPYRESIW